MKKSFTTSRPGLAVIFILPGTDMAMVQSVVVINSTLSSLFQHKLGVSRANLWCPGNDQ